jgi:hypothetical protein
MDAFELLFLAQLPAVFRYLPARLAVLAWRVATPLDGTLIRVAALSLKEKLYALPPT